MSPAARELGMISALKAKAPILDKAQAMRVELGMSPHPALHPPLILSMGDRLIDRGS